MAYISKRYASPNEHQNTSITEARQQVGLWFDF